jgi:hypothetical protein
MVRRLLRPFRAFWVSRLRTQGVALGYVVSAPSVLCAGNENEQSILTHDPSCAGNPPDAIAFAVMDLAGCANRANAATSKKKGPTGVAPFLSFTKPSLAVRRFCEASLIVQLSAQ